AAAGRAGARRARRAAATPGAPPSRNNRGERDEPASARDILQAVRGQQLSGDDALTMRTPSRSTIARGGSSLPACLVLTAAAFLVPDAVGRNAAIIVDTVTIRIYDSAGVAPNERAAAL